jgi:uroporphyrinogen decarboxylase
MNSRERIFATLQGEAVDRRPFAATLSLYGAKLINCPLTRYYRDANEYARGQQAVRDTFDPDIMLSPFSLVAFGEAFGGTLQFYKEEAPNLLHPVISSADEISSLNAPDINSCPTITYMLEALQLIVEAHKRDKAIASVLLSPIEIPAMIMGMEGWMKTVLTDKAGVQRMLDITIPSYIEYSRALLKAGADMLVMPSAFLTPAISNRRIVEEFAMPVLHEVYAQIDAPLFLHNTGSSFFEFLDLFSELPNMAGFIMDNNDDLVQTRKIIGPDKAILGGSDGMWLKVNSADHIKEKCKEKLRQMKNDSHYALVSGGPDVPIETPVENILAMRLAVDEVAADDV